MGLNSKTSIVLRTLTIIMRILVNPVNENPSLLDGSDILRPEAATIQDSEHQFRIYDENADDPIQARVRKTYYDMHSNQTVDFVRRKHQKWLKFNHVEATIMEALEMSNDLVDESDPDLDLPNIVHAFQTAEQIREKHPDKEWFQLVGLIHDLGKIMAFYGEPQWAVVGDTFPVGCEPQDSIVYGKPSFKDNPDMKHSQHSTKYGKYEANCGLDKVLMSWGHDEYLYRVLINHENNIKDNNNDNKHCAIPEEGLAMIRFHSFYPWHAGN